MSFQDVARRVDSPKCRSISQKHRTSDIAVRNAEVLEAA
jgi:hypothetical protein